MAALTPEQESLKQAAQLAHENDFALGTSLTPEFFAFVDKATPATILAILAQLESYITEYEKVANRLAQLEAAQANTDKLLSIIACAYQIVNFQDTPAHILDVLANPEQVTVEQVEAMLPYQPGQDAPDATDELLSCVEDFVGSLKRYPEQLVPINRESITVKALIRAFVEAGGTVPGEPGQ